MTRLSRGAKSATIGFVLATLPACTAIRTDLPPATERIVMTSQKQQAVDLLNAITTGAHGPVAAINPDKYIQHNLSAADGVAGFKALQQAVPGGAKLRVVRVFQDGDYVFAHTEYDVFAPQVGFDIFRFENGKIVEHWDNLEPKAGPNPSGHTMIDGPVEAKELEKTETNKAVARRLVEDVLIDHDFEKFRSYTDGENYTQHHPMIPDGVSPLLDLFKSTAAAGTGSKYNRIHLILGEGNFVLVASDGTLAGKPSSFYDLFRFENAKVVEHWDIIETIPHRSGWKNENGKF